ncbi:MAG: hypothetical protein AAF322_20865, partial [Pseudomonadota bacterium]
MPAEVVQSADMPPGFARLSSAKLAALSPDGLEMSVARLSAGSRAFLDPRFAGAAAWSAAETWFRAAADPEGAGVMLGPSATWHLKAHTPYVVGFRDASGASAEDRMSWPAIRLPSETPP